MLKRLNDRNILKGLFLIVIALAFGLGSFKYQTGRLERAGPGLFPLMVSSMLFVLGVLIVVRSHFRERVPLYFNWKNIAIILTSLAGFALLSQYVNMILGILFLVFCAGAAATTYSVSRNLKVAAALIAVAFAFQKLLGLQLPLY